MEKENLPLYVHGMGRKRLGVPKERLTDEKREEIISEYSLTAENFEIKEITEKGKIIDFSI